MIGIEIDLGALLELKPYHFSTSFVPLSQGIMNLKILVDVWISKYLMICSLRFHMYLSFNNKYMITLFVYA